MFLEFPSSGEANFEFHGGSMAYPTPKVKLDPAWLLDVQLVCVVLLVGYWAVMG